MYNTASPSYMDRGTATLSRDKNSNVATLTIIFGKIIQFSTRLNDKNSKLKIFAFYNPLKPTPIIFLSILKVDGMEGKGEGGRR